MAVVTTEAGGAVAGKLVAKVTVEEAKAAAKREGGLLVAGAMAGGW